MAGFSKKFWFWVVAQKLPLLPVKLDTFVNTQNSVNCIHIQPRYILKNLSFGFPYLFCFFVTFDVFFALWTACFVSLPALWVLCFKIYSFICILFFYFLFSQIHISYFKLVIPCTPTASSTSHITTTEYTNSRAVLNTTTLKTFYKKAHAHTRAQKKKLFWSILPFSCWCCCYCRYCCTLMTVVFPAQVPAGCLSLLVEMDRLSGDPVLFLKSFLDGTDPTSLPTVIDFADFADEISFRSRLNHHFKLVTNVPKSGQRYYIAVYNNDAYIQQRTNYELRAAWVTARIGSPAVLCPKDCWGRGKCSKASGISQFKCHCSQGR